MSRRCYTRADVVLMLLKACKEAGSQKALAEKAGVSDAFLSDVLTGRRDPTDRLVSIVGMERRTIFVCGRARGAVMSRWSRRSHPWKPAPKKVKAQLAAMDSFYGKSQLCNGCDTPNACKAVGCGKQQREEKASVNRNG